MERTLPIDYAKELLTLQEERGGNTHALLEQAGLTFADISRNEITLSQYGRLHAAALKDAADDFLGFPVGGSAPPGTFRMTCLVMLYARNLQTALERGAEFLGLARGLSLKPYCREEGNCFVIGMIPSRELDKQELARVLEGISPLMSVRGLVAWFHLACWLAGRRLKVHRVELIYPADPAISLFEEAFQAPICFNGEENRIYYDLSDLQTPIVQDEESLRVFLKACPYPLMFFAFENRRVGERIRALLGQDFSRPQPMIKEMAKLLGMSVSTLHRNLRAEGLTYQQIKDECRMQACISYLTQPELKLADIATLAGFEETRSFFRSFKRWSGMTPSEFRKQLLAKEGMSDNQNATLEQQLG